MKSKCQTVLATCDTAGSTFTLLYDDRPRVYEVWVHAHASPPAGRVLLRTRHLVEALSALHVSLVRSCRGDQYADEALLIIR